MNSIFDIETAPNEAQVRKLIKPFPDFDPDAIKLGNVKDPAKIKERIEAAADKHATDKANHLANTLDKAALIPAMSTIVAIGIHHEDSTKAEILLGDEKDILTQFWEHVEQGKHDVWSYYSGSNDKSGFDPRHIINRSWFHNIATPQMVDNRGYINGMFVDLAQIYLAGASYPSFCSADQCAKELGLFGEDVGFAKVLSKDDLMIDHKIEGKNFYKFLQSDDYDLEIAMKYLVNDLAIERAIANRIYNY
jgi:hypothetical protein